MASRSEVAHEPRVCDAALTRAFSFLGKRWNGVLLGALVQGPAGFAELKRAVAGISDSVLSERLAELVGAGLISRTVVDGPPVSVTYEATESGQALLPALDALTSWAAENLPAGESL
jgi:DNA-binding HxlR family transcriptional regulator